VAGSTLVWVMNKLWTRKPEKEPELEAVGNLKN
jgi:hypothetical protein